MKYKLGTYVKLVGQALEANRGRGYENVIGKIIKVIEPESTVSGRGFYNVFWDGRWTSLCTEDDVEATVPL